MNDDRFATTGCSSTCRAGSDEVLVSTAGSIHLLGSFGVHFDVVLEGANFR